jgi:ribosomal protein S18 acetylase RimI-like enzyme
VARPPDVSRRVAVSSAGLSASPTQAPASGLAAALRAPIWSALVGGQAPWADAATDGDGRTVAVRYHPDVGPFGAVVDRHDPNAWDALASLVGAGGQIAVWVLPEDDEPEPWPPGGWEVTMDMPGWQMVAETLEPVRDPAAIDLTVADVPAMLDLVSRTRPGPFGRRTVELGGYQGLCHDDDLVAMAGWRMRPGGLTEISAVCTDAGHQGKGLGARLVRSVAADIVAAGEVPFLHVAGVNVGAIRLYEGLGFTQNRAVRFVALRRVGPPR